MQENRQSDMQLIAWTVIIVTSVLFDQLSKSAVLNSPIADGMRAELWPGFIDFRYTRNEGAFFGMMDDKTLLLIIVSGIALIGIAVWVFVERKRIHPLTGIAVSMIIGGGIGNEIDRIAMGSVTDFIHFDFDFPVLHEFPIFNIADIYVTIGAVLLIVSVIGFDRKLFDDKEKKENE